VPGDAMARLVARAERAAEQVLGERSRLGSAAGGMRWKSTAASSFAQRARAGEEMLRADAETLTELAALLRRHASQVEEHLQVLADVARRAALLAEQGIEAVGDASAAAAGVVSDGVSGTGRAAESAGRWLGDQAPW
jgi:ABC-type transporter Mla subunit MlaD